MGHRLSKSALKKTSPEIDNNDINRRSKKELLWYLDNIDRQLEKLTHEIHDKRYDIRSNKIQPMYQETYKNAIFDKNL